MVMAIRWMDYGERSDFVATAKLKSAMNDFSPSTTASHDSRNKPGGRETGISSLFEQNPSSAFAGAYGDLTRPDASIDV